MRSDRESMFAYQTRNMRIMSGARGLRWAGAAQYVMNPIEWQPKVPDLWCRTGFWGNRAEDHPPGRMLISISWLMAGGLPGTCLRAVTHRQVWGPHKNRYRKGGPWSLNNRYGARLTKAAI